MAAPVEQTTNATYSSTVKDCCCDLKEAIFSLYTHQYWTGSNPTDVPSAAGNGLAWGGSRSDDWPLLDGQGPNATVVRRVQGHHTLFLNGAWNVSFTIVLQDDRYFNGSTLQVRGEWVPENPFEWSILGGTGQLTLAQGIIDGTTLSVDPQNERWLNLNFYVLYRPIVNQTRPRRLATLSES